MSIMFAAGRLFEQELLRMCMQIIIWPVFRASTRYTTNSQATIIEKHLLTRINGMHVNNLVYIRRQPAASCQL